MKVRILHSEYGPSPVKPGDIHDAVMLMGGVMVRCPKYKVNLFFEFREVHFICPAEGVRLDTAECIKLGMPKPYLTGADVCATAGTKDEK